MKKYICPYNIEKSMQLFNKCFHTIFIGEDTYEGKQLPNIMQGSGSDKTGLVQ